MHVSLGESEKRIETVIDKKSNLKVRSLKKKKSDKNIIIED